MIVRDADAADFTTACAIVNHFIATTTINFRLEPQQPDEWVADWKASRARFPWLVAADGDRVLGVAYAAPWKSRAAYDRSAEVTVYVAADAARRGIGRALYAELLARLDRAGFHALIAVIALPNAASVALHEACGFTAAGTLREVGWKFGAWCDTGFWQRLAT